MGRSFNFSGQFNLGKLVWLCGLSESESGPVRRMVEDVEANSVGKDFDVEFVEISSRNELEKTLIRIAREAEFGENPAIHFDFHGDINSGLYISISNEYMDWKSLVVLLREINIKSDNGLFVFFATCYAYNLVYEASIKLETPFAYGIMPEKGISSGDLEDNVANFYSEIISGKDAYSAYLDRFSKCCIDYNYQQVFFEVLIGYFRAHCNKAEIDKRVRELSAQLSAEGVLVSRQQKRKMERFAKKSLRPSQAIIDQYSKRFLINREPQFNFSQLKPFLIAEGVIE